MSTAQNSLSLSQFLRCVPDVNLDKRTTLEYTFKTVSFGNKINDLRFHPNNCQPDELLINNWPLFQWFHARLTLRYIESYGGEEISEELGWVRMPQILSSVLTWMNIRKDAIHLKRDTKKRYLRSFWGTFMWPGAGPGNNSHGFETWSGTPGLRAVVPFY